MWFVSPIKFFLSLFGYVIDEVPDEINSADQMCPAFIRHVGTGISRTGTQTVRQKLIQRYDDHRIGVYNSMTQMKLNHLQLVKNTVPCNGVSDSFKDWYYTVLATSTTPELASIDVPMNFCYKEIAQLQMQSGFQNFSLLMTYRRPDDWVNSFRHLLVAFAPIAGYPYSFFVGDMVSHTANQFLYHMNCTIRQMTLFGFTLTAWMEDPLACHAGFVKWNDEVSDFARENNIRVVNASLGSSYMGSESFGVNSNELLFLTLVSRVPALVCLFVLADAVRLVLQYFEYNV